MYPEMPFAIMDTSVYINHWEGVLDDQALAWLRAKFVVRRLRLYCLNFAGVPEPQKRGAGWRSCAG